MRVVKLVEMCAKMMETLSENGIKMEDYKYLPLFYDYERMLGEGDKTTYIVMCLQEKYNIPERSIYRVLERFKKAAKL